MLVKLEPEQISRVVSQSLREFYQEIKIDPDFDVNVGLGVSREEILRALISIIDYYTIPTEYDTWIQEQQIESQ